MMDVMIIKGEPAASFGPPCSDPFPFFCFTPLTRVQLVHPDDRHQDSTMNQIVSLNTTSTLTMSSREIAELTGKRHPDVKRDIFVMLPGLGLDASRFAHTYRDKQNRQQVEIKLLKRETLILVSGYSVALRARIVDPWMELEERAVTPALPDFSNPAMAARAWAEQFEAKQIA
jgi:phage regulator Rha-like protein